MIRRCLFCAAALEPNEALEHMPHGDRFAFDPARGRLWAVCRHCRRWNLAPIEARWEALEELERLATDRAKLLAKTDNIALLRADRLDLVRVGRAERTEEAWWRYGRELTGRRQQFRKVSVIGSAAVGAAILGGWTTGAIGWFGAWMLWNHAPGKAADAVRWLRFGSTAWRGELRCPKCDFPLRHIDYARRDRLVLLNDGAGGGVTISRRCPRCGSPPTDGLRLGPREGERVTRRILAYHHFAGASEKRVRAATNVIAVAGSPRDFTQAALLGGRYLKDLDRTTSIALEITANETAEQVLLEAELSDLEAIWREEEQVAAIADGELTPVPPLEKLRRRLSGIVPVG